MAKRGIKTKLSGFVPVYGHPCSCFFMSVSVTLKLKSDNGKHILIEGKHHPTNQVNRVNRPVVIIV